MSERPGRAIRITSTKYDGSPHWDFDSWFIREEGPLLVTMNFAGQELTTWRGPWITPYETHNHFWSDRWYNVMRLQYPRGGDFDGWYCNVATPARYDGETVRYADLDLDVRVSAEGKPKVLDEDEFLENSRRMGYPPEVIEQARTAVDELVRLARAGEFPFEQRSGL